MSKLYSILILEDDLKTLSAILDRLSVLEESYPVNFNLTILSDHTQVEKYINGSSDTEFDIILLDRDCKLGGSFHVLDVERFGVDKVISISSVPDYNEQLRKRGVTRIVHKDYADIDTFSKQVIGVVEEMIK